MNDVKILAFVGMPGAGKGTCTDYLAKKYDWPVVHFGNMFYAELQRRGLDNVKDENWFRAKLREEEGPAVLAKLVAVEIQRQIEQGQKIVVLDGLYTWTEYKYLHEKFAEDLIVIAVAAPRKLRYQRILNRDDAHRKYRDEKQIWDRDVSEIEKIEKGGPIANADYTLVNDSSQEKLLKDLDKVLEQLGL